MLAASTVQAPLDQPFSVRGGLIRYKGRVWIGDNTVVQQMLLQEFQASALGGHSRVQATYNRLMKLFAWPRLKQNVKQFVSRYVVCKQAKPEHVPYLGLLQALPVPEQAWQMVTLDFVEGLPKSQGCDVILVVVDKLKRYAHFIPLKHPFTALHVAQAYMDYVFKLHGPPDAMVSDRDRIFTTKV